MNAVTVAVVTDLTAIAKGLRDLRELPPEEALAWAERIQAFHLDVVSETPEEIRVKAVYAGQE